MEVFFNITFHHQLHELTQGVLIYLFCFASQANARVPPPGSSFMGLEWGPGVYHMQSVLKHPFTANTTDFSYVICRR